MDSDLVVLLRLFIAGMITVLLLSIAWGIPFTDKCSNYTLNEYESGNIPVRCVDYLEEARDG